MLERKVRELQSKVPKEKVFKYLDIRYKGINTLKSRKSSFLRKYRRLVIVKKAQVLLMGILTINFIL